MHPQNTHGLLVNTSISSDSFLSNNILNAADGFFVLKFSPNLVPQLIWCEDWMNSILVYWLCFRLLIPCLCNYKTCQILGLCFQVTTHTNMMMSRRVLQILPDLVPQLGCSEALVNNIPWYWICSSLVRTYPCSHTPFGVGGNQSIACVSSHRNITNLRVAWLFCNSFQILFHSLGTLRLWWTASLCIDCL